jgi:ABC-type nitrate/sulfonate/bicarbonate transport system substrate-binding protein
MIQALRSAEIDVGIGLTEGWVAGLGKNGGDGGYKLIGTYVESPLCWAISTGAGSRLDKLSQLRGRKLGVSRVGSGSYVMGYVLADQEQWLGSSDPFQVVPLNTFDKLREAVNDGTADFFMWEYYTSKRYYEKREIKQIGEIYTPWSSWKIAARNPADKRVPALMEEINKGIEYFRGHTDEAVKYISTELDYSVEDAEAWMKTVQFPKNVEGVNPAVLEQTITALVRAGVLEETARNVDMLAIKKRP